MDKNKRMDASEVLQQLSVTWTSMLDKFYDSIEDEMITWISKEHKIPIATLRAKAAPLKEKLLSKATESVNNIKTTKKADLRSKISDSSKYGKMLRKELIELSKERNLPVKRKNQDMINALKKYDEVYEKGTEPETTTHDDDEPEVELEIPVVKKFKKSVPKAKKTSIPLTETLVEETISSDEED